MACGAGRWVGGTEGQGGLPAGWGARKKGEPTREAKGERARGQPQTLLASPFFSLSSCLSPRARPHRSTHPLLLIDSLGDCRAGGQGRPGREGQGQGGGDHGVLRKGRGERLGGGVEE